MIINKMADAIRAIDNTREYNCQLGDIDSIKWVDGKAPISKSDIEAKMAELENADAQKATDKANAKAKLIAGEALTEAEADTIVL